jgi:hypothetical protein
MTWATRQRRKSSCCAKPPSKRGLLRRCTTPQPWRFVLTENALEIYADPRRQLTVLDPTGRQLVISCGCAVFNARVALAACGYRAVVERLQDSARPQLLTRITVTSEPGDPLQIGALDVCIINRQTNRRRFTDKHPWPRVARIADRRCSARAGRTRRDIHNGASPCRDQTEPAGRSSGNADPAYHDGVPAVAVAVPHVTGNSRDDISIRDYDTRGTGSLRPETRSQLD